METQQKIMIAAIGGHLSNTNPKAVLLAESFGSSLAQKGFTVICGGEDGIMEAICRGSKAANGTTMAIMKGNKRSDANKYVDYTILTSMDLAFMNVLIWSADGVIAFDGRYGTMSEIGLALDIGKPTIAVGTHKLINLGDVQSPYFAYYPGYDISRIPQIVEQLATMITRYKQI